MYGLLSMLIKEKGRKEWTVSPQFINTYLYNHNILQLEKKKKIDHRAFACCDKETYGFCTYQIIYKKAYHF